MTTTSQKIPDSIIEHLEKGIHYNPHSILGLHQLTDDEKVIRLWRPGAAAIHIDIKGITVLMERVHEAGLFEKVVPATLTHQDYVVYHQSGLRAHDPYTFSPTIGDIDEYLFSQGTHYNLYDALGAHPCLHQGIAGVKFSVWAPGAAGVSLIADHNHYDGMAAPMRALGDSGIWDLFVPGLRSGEKYKYEIRSPSGELRVKSDPMGFAYELRPKTAAIVTDVNSFEWTDHQWMEQREKKKDAAMPMSVYEVHLGSWKRIHGNTANYRELARVLGDYCKEMGFTHVELMPVAEHPFDQSWGYQVTGYYAPTSRFGTPQDFQYFVNHLHKIGIGVIVDWVPGHFPADDFALARFDGTCLYEHADSRQGFHPHWNTLIFNFGRHEVANFLIANALFWAEKMHIDGFRVDAVASVLYLDYGREEGEWIPNKYGGKENLEAIEFLKHFNSVVHSCHPGVVTIAEESTAFPGVSHPVDHNGLGFDMKWNMGWMNDTLRYFNKDPLFRRHHHDDLTFGLLYAFTEKFSLVLSHDEVVHGKKSLLSKMPGDTWQQFANLRLLYSYMVAQPGKQLLFMGGEIGQWDEWDCDQEVQWHLLQYPPHSGLQCCVKEINLLYQGMPALWEKDFDDSGFEWVDFGDKDNSVICYLRKSSNQQILCVHHFTPGYHEDYFVNISGITAVREIFNSDNARYGGSDKVNRHPVIHRDEGGHAVGIGIKMAPLATMLFEIEY